MRWTFCLQLTPAKPALQTYMIAEIFLLCHQRQTEKDFNFKSVADTYKNKNVYCVVLLNIATLL